METKCMELKPCPFCGDDAKFERRAGCQQYRAICDNCNIFTNWKWSERQAAETWNRRYEPPNEPLTLDELAQMEEEPVWITFDGTERPKKASHWYLFMGRFGETFFITGFCETWRLSCENYGKTWLAYRRRPEEENDATT